MNENLKKTSISFGNIFLSFLLVFLLALFSISMQTSTKLISENEDRIESNMASSLDSIVAHTTEESYVFRSYNNIIEIALKEGIESEKLSDAINAFVINEKITAKFFFYKNNEFIKGFNHSEKDLNLFKDILNLMKYKRGDPEYIEANRKPDKELQNIFGPNNRLETLKLRKGLLSLYYLKNTNQYYYWNSYENGLGIFFYSLKIPNFIERVKNIVSITKNTNIGAIDSSNKNFVTPNGFSEDQILTAYLKSGKTSKSFIESNDNYWLFQTTNDSNKICFTIPINNNSYTFYNWANYIEKTSAILFILILIIYLTSLLKIIPGKQLVKILDNTSIRFRIIGIFSMASIFPVLMAIIIGYSVLSDKEKVIEESILSESLTGISKIEDQYKVLENKTLQCAKDLREAIKYETVSETLLNKYLEKYSIPKDLTRLDVRDANVNTIFTMDDREVNGFAEVMDLICRITLKLHTPQRVDSKTMKISPGEIVSEGMLSTDELGYASLIRQRGKQWRFKVGVHPSLWYWDVYPELATGPAFICFVTQPGVTYQKQLSDYFKTSHVASDSIQLYAYINERFYTPTIQPIHNKLPVKQLVDLAVVAFRTNKVVFRSIEIDGNPCWVTVKQEKNVYTHIFFHLISKKERLKVLTPLKWRLFLSGLFALIISLSGAWFITRLVIIPIKDLSNGIEAIRFRYKDYMIPVRRKDEFGEIASAFNRVLKEMSEMEYGKIVQESLLPSEEPKIPGYDIAFFTVSASDLAGDYHDYVMLDDNKISIILGDVSGHGISASLAMAMAKATFNYAKAKNVKFPEDFMDMLNTIINKELKPRNKLMTLISMILTPETGEVIFDNAGQSFPAYYSSSTNSSEEIKMPSLPSGGMKKRKRKPVTKNMAHGDAFIFYTDGIIEASSASGEMFGYERFFETFTEQMKNNISSKEAINNIYQAVENFREPGHHSDDITLIIVKRL